MMARSQSRAAPSRFAMSLRSMSAFQAWRSVRATARVIPGSSRTEIEFGKAALFHSEPDHGFKKLGRDGIKEATRKTSCDLRKVEYLQPTVIGASGCEPPHLECERSLDYPGAPEWCHVQ